MRSLRFFVLTFSFCVVTACGVTQSLSAPEWIYGNDAGRRAGLSALGFDREITDLYAGERFSTSSGIQWHPLRGGEPGVILFLPCGAMQEAYVGLLRWREGRWMLVNEVGADCHYDGRVSIELLALIPNGRETLLVHNDCTGHGTGYVEQRLVIYEVGENSLKKRFDALEHMYSALDGTGIEEVRHFIPVRSLQGTWSLEDTCVMTGLKNGTPLERKNAFRREIRWSVAMHQFEITPFRTLGSSKGSCAAGESGLL